MLRVDESKQNKGVNNNRLNHPRFKSPYLGAKY